MRKFSSGDTEGEGWGRKVFRPRSASFLNPSVESVVCVLATTLRKQRGNSFESEESVKVVKVVRCKKYTFLGATFVQTDTTRPRK